MPEETWKKSWIEPSKLSLSILLTSQEEVQEISVTVPVQMYWEKEQLYRYCDIQQTICKQTVKPIGRFKDRT